jgi:chemotaxis protein MotA
MKATTAIGIALGLLLLAAGATLEGTSLLALLNLPAFLVVFGGTLGATMAGTSMDRIKAIPKLFVMAFKGVELDLAGRHRILTDLAERARREGLLALDNEVADIDDEFTRKGMQLVVDGTDPEVVREIMEVQVDGMAHRHSTYADTFEKGAGFAPTMGIIGTVMGLISVLKNLSDPASLGPSISVAFIATLYGVGMANCVFLPVANKLKQLSREEVELRTMTLEGILAIQAGENPRVISDKLLSFIPPAQRADDDGGGGGGDEFGEEGLAPDEELAA